MADRRTEPGVATAADHGRRRTELPPLARKRTSLPTLDLHRSSIPDLGSLSEVVASFGHQHAPVMLVVRRVGSDRRHDSAELAAPTRLTQAVRQRPSKPSSPKDRDYRDAHRPDGIAASPQVDRFLV
jgi:hypothetical protein